MLFVLLAVAAVSLLPTSAQAKPFCGRVTAYSWFGTVVGVYGYSAASCGCSLIQWGAATSEAQIVYDYCPSF
jgi:hypothetical protein